MEFLVTMVRSRILSKSNEEREEDPECPLLVEEDLLFTGEIPLELVKRI